MNELYEHIAKLEAQYKDVANLDKRLRNPFYLREGRPVVWYSPSMPMLDTMKQTDLRIQIEEFSRRTDNLYGTRENVKVQ